MSDFGQVSALFEACFPVLKTEWELLGCVVNVLSAEEVIGCFPTVLFNIDVLYFFSG